MVSDFFFLLHEFIYLLLLVAIAHLILHKEMVENFCCLLEYYQFTLTSDNMKIILKFRGSCPDQWKNGEVWK